MRQKDLVALALLALAVVSTPAVAQTVPHRAAGNNASYMPATGHYEGFGVGTHIGRHAIIGDITSPGTPIPPFVQFDEEAGLWVFFDSTFEGEQLIVAANGDKIKCKLSGTVKLYWITDDFGNVYGAFGQWNPEFEIIPGSTGRFANATGRFAGTAINPPFDPAAAAWPFNWEVAGTIDLGKKGKKAK
jgi:hypothetical protein